MAPSLLLRRLLLVLALRIIHHASAIVSAEAAAAAAGLALGPICCHSGDTINQDDLHKTQLSLNSVNTFTVDPPDRDEIKPLIHTEMR